MEILSQEWSVGGEGKYLSRARGSSVLTVSTS